LKCEDFSQSGSRLSITPAASDEFRTLTPGVYNVKIEGSLTKDSTKAAETVAKLTVLDPCAVEARNGLVKSGEIRFGVSAAFEAEDVSIFGLSKGANE